MVKQKAKASKTTQKTNNGTAGSLEVSTAQLAYLFGISDRQIRNWVNQMGCPKLAHGLFDLKAVLDWWIASDLIGSRLESNDEEVKNVKVEYWKWKTENEKMKAQQTARKLIPEEEIAEQWALRLAAVSSGLDMLPYQIAPHLEMVDQATAIKVLSEKIWVLKDNFCRSGQFCAPVSAGD